MTTSSFYQKIFKSLPGIYLILDEEYNVIYANDFYQHVASFLTDNIVGKNLLEIYQEKISPEDFKKLQQSLKKIKEHSADGVELKINLPGKSASLRKKEKILKITHACVDKHIIHAIHDITDDYIIRKIKNQQDKLTEGLLTQAGEMEQEIYQYVKQLEEKNNELLEINATLIKSEAIKSRLATVVEHTEDSVITVSISTGEIETWNAGAKKLYGYDASEVIGHSIKIIFPPERIHEFHDGLEKIMRGQSVHYFDTQRLHKEGRIIPVSVTVSPIKNIDGDVFAVCSISRDISEYKTLRHLEKKNKELMALSNLKNSFIANVSHEFRTPLHGILGFGKLLLLNCSEQQKEYVAQIISGGQYLNSLINDVLDFTKIESGKMELTITEIDLSVLIEDIKKFFHDSLLRKNIKFTVDIDASLEFVFSDLKKIKQIIYNYISNAIKFTAQKGEIHLEFKLEPDNKFRLTVTDNGIGIAEHNLDKLFVEFQQLDQSTTKNYPGTGLGLAIVRKIAILLKGEVGVISQLNKGSSFFVILPCQY